MEEVREMEGKAIYQKMINVMEEIGPIVKDQKNLQQNYKYRGAEQIYNKLKPLLAAHGIIITPEILEMVRGQEVVGSKGNAMMFTVLKIKYTFTAADDGSSISAIVAGEGMDSGDKATNKAMTAAWKYAMIQCFNLATEDVEDSDKTDPTGGKGLAPNNKPEQKPLPKKELTPADPNWRKFVESVGKKIDKNPADVKKAFEISDENMKEFEIQVANYRIEMGVK